MVPILTVLLHRLPSYGLPSQLVLHATPAGTNSAILALHKELRHVLPTMYANASSTDECPSLVATVSVIGLGHSVCTVAAVAADCSCVAFRTTIVVGLFAIVVALAVTMTICRTASEAKRVAAYASVKNDVSICSPRLRPRPSSALLSKLTPSRRSPPCARSCFRIFRISSRPRSRQCAVLLPAFRPSGTRHHE
jgi:hypothetical protein